MPFRRACILLAAYLSIGAGAPCNLTSPPYIFMEIDPLNADSASTQATLPTQIPSAISFKLANAANTSFRFDDDSNADNTSVSFSGEGFCPSAANLDDLLLLLDNDNTATDVDAVLTITFSTVVENPIFHLDNLDRAAWDFSPTTLDLSLLACNDEATLKDGVLLDSDPMTAGGSLSADASVRVNGSFEVIIVHLREVLAGRNDSFGLQISVDQPTRSNIAVPTLNNAGLIALILLLAAIGGARIREAGNRLHEQEDYDERNPQIYRNST